MIRADLDSLPAYVPGKRYPDALKLSSNEVTQGPLPEVRARMDKALDGVNRYPDMGVVDLKEALAKKLDLPTEQIAVGCGSSALCQQLVQVTTLPGEEVVFPWRSFEAYPIFTQVVGATPVAVPLTEEQGLDLDAMAAAVTERTKLVFVCNPNNPSGTTITEEAFRAFMAKVPENIVVALDEAYMEFCRDGVSPIARELIGEYPNLVGLRTFSKAYGLAGLRVGYAFGAEEIIHAVNKVGIPFAVNSLAQAAAIASLEVEDQLEERIDAVVAARERAAAAIPGAIKSQANFVWVPTTPERSKELAAELAEKEVLVRSFPEGVRITVTNEEETDRLLAAWPKGEADGH